MLLKKQTELSEIKIDEQSTEVSTVLKPEFKEYLKKAITIVKDKEIDESNISAE